MKRKAFIHLLISLVLIVPLLLFGSCLAFDTFTPQSPQANSANSPQVTNDNGPIEAEWELPAIDAEATVMPNFIAVVAKVKPSVTAINTEVITYDIFNQPIRQQGAGSGWIIDKNGLIVTNNHVVEGAQSITVTLADNRTFPAVTVRTDPLTDIAVIKIDATGLPAASIGDSFELQVGEPVAAIGNPLGMGISMKGGWVSRLGVSIDVSSTETLYDLIETDAAINPGNSGGPLVNLAGEVVGITSAKLSAVGIEGMGYAISSQTAIPIIKQLIQTGYVIRPWLGAGLYTVDPYVVFRYNLKVNQGVLVTEVYPGGPADTAGIMAGDVITSVKGQEITTAQDLMQLVHSLKIGDQITITFVRGETEKTVKATLTESPPPS